jgi:hypothetical protein
MHGRRHLLKSGDSGGEMKKFYTVFVVAVAVAVVVDDAWSKNNMRR